MRSVSSDEAHGGACKRASAQGWSVVPWGFKHLLLWCQRRYKPSGGIYVTENGCAVLEPTKEEAVNDTFRVAFLASYVAALHEAIEEGADVRGYYAWSFL
jgi:beta-glucosidase/6-phospho-beta-glucosidase/beta-galactosidase